MKIGIVGGGSIVKTFLSITGLLENIKVTAIYTRRSEAAEALADKYNIAAVCRSYEQLLEEDIDFVYIAVPNHLHFDFAHKALCTKKNVILEKPFTATLKQAEILFEKAKENKLYLFEAISNLYNPVAEEIYKSIGKVGKILKAQINYLQYSSRYDDFKKGIIHPVFDPEKYGGVLMDLGVYCIHLLCLFFGKPIRADYIPIIENGIDTEGTIKLDYDGFCAECLISKARDGECGIMIEAANGSIESPVKPNELTTATLTINGESHTLCSGGGAERLCYEWRAFEQIYRNGDYDKMLDMMKYTLCVSEVLDMLTNK